jgi:hypothetical protein
MAAVSPYYVSEKLVLSSSVGNIRFLASTVVPFMVKLNCAQHVNNVESPDVSDVDEKVQLVAL